MAVSCLQAERLQWWTGALSDDCGAAVVAHEVKREVTVML